MGTRGLRSRYGGFLPQSKEFFDVVDDNRYRQDYMLRGFARFGESAGRHVLEVGLGTGSDFCQWLRVGAIAHGVDLTRASVDMVKRRIALEGMTAEVEVGDAESLPYPDKSFDIYYSWGVLHHTPDIDASLAEAFRVLKPGGTLKIMLYHYPSVAVFLIWLLYGVLGRDRRPARELWADHVESPDTKVLTIPEARALMERHFPGRPVEIHTYLASGDLLTQLPSGRYKGPLWRLVFALYPRWFVSRFIGDRFGTYMTIHSVK